ncbi:hypothetical protein ZHAS_00008747 [Anopheles sinensis]|uniref:Uncharacterized protein n=1 Tax=Anopheles sinensis TaxID=74873 RepID=A0A084VT65_ANOSI|nr:hypothetical protein ZHAS_00008747 [Anopheles sinensis]
MLLRDENNFCIPQGSSQPHPRVQFCAKNSTRNKNPTGKSFKRSKATIPEGNGLGLMGGVAVV